MGSPARSCWIEDQAGACALHLQGAWRLAGLRKLAPELARAIARAPDAAPGAAGEPRATAEGSSGAEIPTVIDGSRLQEIDTAGALLLLSALQDAGTDVAAVELRGFDAGHARIVEVVRARLPETTPSRRRRPMGPLAQLGAATERMGTLLLGHVSFLGRAFVELGRGVSRPQALRWHELFAQLGQVCVTAIPVVALVTFLIGVVMAYLLGLQAEKYGANIFVVDGVALGMTREFSPLIVATIVAGRSGAAFTAQLGTMKLTEEIDAIRTLGLSPDQVLVVPRILALVIALPLLVFVGDVMGLGGAMLMANSMLEVTPATFLDRLHVALDSRHYLIGLGKSPVFALFIGVIGCAMGLGVSRDTRSIGINTTSTVVQSIVAVILLDAIFAVLFQAMGL
jgi:phospholipid/cholesterol/gamma-HCH transport system permease protein